MGVTAFLGSGTALEISRFNSSTYVLTQVVRRSMQTFQGIGLPLIDKVGKILDNYYAPKKCNFEDIFYVLEMLETYIRTKDSKYHTFFKAPFAPFIELGILEDIFKVYFDEYREYYQRDSNKNVIPILISTAKSDLIKMIGYEIAKYSNSPLENWYESFWKKATSANIYNIATLNYDTTIEQSIITFNDGFEDTGCEFYRFNPKLLNNSVSNILHLHGCITYGYGNRTEINKFKLVDNHEDLSKFNTFCDAVQTWKPKQEYISQSKDETIIGPIITGLRKTDKLIAYPYSYYYFWLNKSLVENKNLFIVGYSFGDLHFNSLLERLLRLHNDCKIVIIDYIDFNSHPCKNAEKFEGWPFDASYPIFSFFAKTLKTKTPLETLVKSNIKNGEPAISDDKNTRIYFGGFKNTIEKYGDDIINFLEN